MSSKGNTRPISRSRTSSTNSRGRVYKCRHCDINAYKGEKLRVEQHIYRKHIALDSVPFYCNICKFVTTSQSDLEQHLNIKTYPTHAATVNAMLEAGQCVFENESMLQNIAYYKIGDKDMERLEREASEEIYSARKEKRTKSQTKSQTNDILRTVMLTSNIPVVTKDLIETLSCTTENILPALLGTDVLLSPAPISLTHHSSPAAPVYAPVKTNQPTATSSTSSSSSSSSVREREEMRKEIKELREATKTMAQAMDSLITEVNMMRKEMTETREEKRAQKEKKEKEKEKEKEREREERARGKENVERGIQRRREWEQRDHHFHPYRR